MLDLELLRHPPFAAATGAAFATGAGSIALFSFLPGFVGIALGMSASGAAWLLLAWSGTSVVSALLARRIPPRVPGRVQLAIGLAGVGIGQLALAGVDTGSTWRHFVPGARWSPASPAACSTPRSAARRWPACPRTGPASAAEPTTPPATSAPPWA